MDIFPGEVLEPKKEMLWLNIYIDIIALLALSGALEHSS